MLRIRQTYPDQTDDDDNTRKWLCHTHRHDCGDGGDNSNEDHHTRDRGDDDARGNDNVGHGIRHVHDAVVQLIQTYQPDALAVEELFFNTNVTTGISVAEARGVILLSGIQHGITVAEYTPLQVKQAVVGYGKAEKKQVMTMVAQILRLKAVPKPDDTADALAIAICHAQYGGTALKQALLRGER